MATYQSSYSGAQIDQAIGAALAPDTTLSQAGKLADAKAVGDEILFKFVPENLYDADNLVGTMVINGTSVSNLSNWIELRAGCVYLTDYTYTQFYYFDTEKNYVSQQSLISNINRITASADGFLLINTKGENKRFVRGSYFEYDTGIKSRWNGKKWLAIGDSITDIAVANKGYPFIVGSNLGMEVTNIGNSGKVMSYFHDKVAGFSTDYDLITVLLGTNNQGYNTAIGSLNDQYYQSGQYDSNSSFYAQTQRLADLLIAKYPYSTIVFLTPIRRSVSSSDGADKTNALGLTVQPYAEAIKTVCAAYGIPCLDLYTHGINPKYDENRATFFVDGDGTHPNNDGHAKFTAPVISNYLVEIAPFYERPVILTSITAVYNGYPVPVGTDVSTLDVTVTAHYDNGTSAAVTDYTISGTIVEGTNTVTITYLTKTTTISVIGVVAPIVVSISAVYTGGAVPAGTNVNDLTGLTVTATYSDSSTSEVTGYTLSGTINYGVNTITVTYDEATTTFSVTGTAALLHQYTYVEGGEDFGDGNVGFYDEIGNYNISTLYSSSMIKGDPSDTDAARASWGLNAGDSFTFVFKGVKRYAVYNTQSIYFMLTAGNGANTACLGRQSAYRMAEWKSGGATTYCPDAVPLVLNIYNAGGNHTSTNTFASTRGGNPQDVVISYDSSTGTAKVTVDDVEFLNIDVGLANKDLIHVDGLAFTKDAVITSKHFVFSQIQIYNGIIENS